MKTQQRTDVATISRAHCDKSNNKYEKKKTIKLWRKQNTEPK